MAIRTPNPSDEARMQVLQRRHPARSLLDRVASGHQPTPEEAVEIVMMAAPENRAAVRERLAETVASCQWHLSRGEQQTARRLSRRVAFELGELAGPVREQRVQTTDPRELASMIARR